MEFASARLRVADRAENTVQCCCVSNRYSKTEIRLRHSEAPKVEIDYLAVNWQVETRHNFRVVGSGLALLSNQPLRITTA